MSEVIAGQPLSQKAEEVDGRLEHLRLQLLGAVDAARGAEAERGVLEARVRELECQHHMLKVEREELRRELVRLTGRKRSLPFRIVSRFALAWKRRLIRG